VNWKAKRPDKTANAGQKDFFHRFPLAFTLPASLDYSIRSHQDVWWDRLTILDFGYFG
jgi:hypothetical protein